MKVKRANELVIFGMVLSVASIAFAVYAAYVVSQVQLSATALSAALTVAQAQIDDNTAAASAAAAVEAAQQLDLVEYLLMATGPTTLRTGTFDWTVGDNTPQTGAVFSIKSQQLGSINVTILELAAPATPLELVAEARRKRAEASYILTASNFSASLLSPFGATTAAVVQMTDVNVANFVLSSGCVAAQTCLVRSYAVADSLVVTFEIILIDTVAEAGDTVTMTTALQLYAIQ